MNKPITNQARAARVATLLCFALILAIALSLFAWQWIHARPYYYSPDMKTLLYHLVADETYGDYTYLFVREEDFENQLREIQKQGFTTYFADAPQEAEGGVGVVITFDDGYIDNYTTVFPLLKKYNMKATIFVITDLIGTEGYLTAEQIREMSESGLVHFGSHTVTHRKLDTLSEHELRKEFADSKAVLEALTGQDVTALAYPNGVFTETAEQVLVKTGYRFAYTTNAPAETYYENTRLPRDYVVRDMAWEDFLAILELTT